MNTHIRVVAPAFSLGVISKEVQKNAVKTIESMSWELSFGKHTGMENDGSLASVKRRVDDIHEALMDSSVTHLMAVIGGWDSHELLPFINWDLWRNNPKPLIGYSDITSLQTAAFTMSGVISIHGPAFSTLGQKNYLEYSLKQLAKCISCDPHVLEPAKFFIDDEWFLDLDCERDVHKTNDMEFLRQSEAAGVAIGGNLSTLITLAGTRYFSELSDKILFLEEIGSVSTPVFRRMFVQLLRQPGAERIRGFVFGRNQIQSPLKPTTMVHLVQSFVPENVPVIVNASFGHTYPIGSFPIGREVSIKNINNIPLIKVT